MSQIVCFLGVTAVGASAVLLPRFSVAGVLAELRGGDASFTLLGGVPTTYSALLDAVRGEESGGGLGAPALRGCVSAGAAAGPGFRESFEAICGAPYLEHYGSTEAGPVTMPAAGRGDIVRPGAARHPGPGRRRHRRPGHGGGRAVGQRARDHGRLPRQAGSHRGSTARRLVPHGGPGQDRRLRRTDDHGQGE